MTEIRPVMYTDMDDDLRWEVSRSLERTITEITTTLYGIDRTNPFDLPPAQQRDHYLARLAAIESLTEYLRRESHHAAYVTGGIDEAPATYADLGAAVGISRQAARTRFAGAVPDSQPGRPRTHVTEEFVMVVYRNSDAKVDDDGSERIHGETGGPEDVQLEADRKWWRIANTRRDGLRGIVYVHEGVVVRVRAVDPTGIWGEDSRGYADVPVGPPLTAEEISEQLPTLDLRPGDPMPHTQGPSRRYLPL